MYGASENQAGAIRAGLARRACGEDVRLGEILAASVKQEPTVSAVTNRLVGIHFLQGVEEVKTGMHW
jgi:hypothetical protein